MKIVLAGLFLMVLFTFSTTAQIDSINIVPRPRSTEIGSGSFTINSDTRIVSPDKASKRNAEILAGYLQSSYGTKLKTTSKAQDKNAIVFASPAAAAGPEDYSL